jgi:hypothetical protein
MLPESDPESVPESDPESDPDDDPDYDEEIVPESDPESDPDNDPDYAEESDKEYAPPEPTTNKHKEEATSHATKLDKLSSECQALRFIPRQPAGDESPATRDLADYSQEYRLKLLQQQIKTMQKQLGGLKIKSPMKRISPTKSLSPVKKRIHRKKAIPFKYNVVATVLTKGPEDKNPKLMVERHKFLRDNKARTEESGGYNWKCSQYGPVGGCPMRGITPNGLNEPVLINLTSSRAQQHNHESLLLKNISETKQANLLIRARETTDKPRAIVNEILTDMPAECVVHLPSEASLAQAVCRERRK